MRTRNWSVPVCGATAVVGFRPAGSARKRRDVVCVRDNRLSCLTVSPRSGKRAVRPFFSTQDIDIAGDFAFSPVPGVVRHSVGMQFYSKKLLSSGQLKRLSEHKYSCTTNSFLDARLQPWWEWLVSKVPFWLAPNLITVLGLIVNIITTLILVYYSPDAKVEVRLVACLTTTARPMCISRILLVRVRSFVARRIFAGNKFTFDCNSDCYVVE